MAMEQTIKTKKVGLELLPDGPDRRLELLRDGPERRLKLLSDRTGGKRKEVRDYSLILFIKNKKNGVCSNFYPHVLYIEICFS
jgi:hypothetical protein